MDYWTLVNYSHLLILAPLFIYLGYKDGQVQPWLYPVVLYLGIFVLLYHAYLTIKNYRSGNTMYIVNLFHALVIGPLLISVGLRKTNTGYPIPTLMLILGVGALFHYAKKIISG